MGLPEGGDNLGMEAADVAGLGRQAGPLALPVVLRWGRDAVAVVASAHHQALFQGREGLAHLGQTRVGGNGRVQGGGNVLGGAVDAAHVLQQADHLGDGLGEGVIDLPADVVDLGADLAADVA